MIPQLNTIIRQRVIDLNQIHDQRRKMGIKVTHSEYVEDQMVMGEGRDIVLNDLNSASMGRGILFDNVALDELTQEQIIQLAKSLEDLEKSYSTEGHPNQNSNVVKFLKLYGLGEGGSGEALENLLEEMRNRL